MDSFTEDLQLLIKLPDTSDHVCAQFRPVQLFSSCANGLPAPNGTSSVEWDLSGILIDGQHVSRQTVISWLNVLYNHVHAVPFEQTGSDISSAANLYQLLAFADAVGSSRGLLLACLSQISQLHMTLAVQDRQVQLVMDGRAYCFHTHSPALQLYSNTAEGRAFLPCLGSVAEKENLISQAAQQTEQLLYIAHQLQLHPLITKLHQFISSSTIFPSSIFKLNVLYESLFTPRVLAAAGFGSNHPAKEEWVQSILAQPCGFLPGKPGFLLRPINLTDQQKQPLAFRAVLEQDFVGLKKGSNVDVKLELLSGARPRMLINNLAFGAALSIGREAE